MTGVPGDDARGVSRCGWMRSQFLPPHGTVAGRHKNIDAARVRRRLLNFESRRGVQQPGENPVTRGIGLSGDLGGALGLAAQRDCLDLAGTGGSAVQRKTYVYLPVGGSRRVYIALEGNRQLVEAPALTVIGPSITAVPGIAIGHWGADHQP